MSSLLNYSYLSKNIELELKTGHKKVLNVENLMVKLKGSKKGMII